MSRHHQRATEVACAIPNRRGRSVEELDRLDRRVMDLVERPDVAESDTVEIGNGRITAALLEAPRRSASRARRTDYESDAIESGRAPDSLLGSTELTGPGGEPIPEVLSRPKRLALLSYLALQAPGDFCRRETLVGQFWPELNETKARANLSVVLHHLRRLVGKDVVITRGIEEIGLDPDAIWVDTWAFLAAIERGELEAAATLYRGPLLDGLHVLGSASFSQFLEERRYRLRSAALEVFSDLADRALEDERPEGRKWLRMAFALAPADNRLAHRLMQCEARAGHSSLALQVYDNLVGRMRQDLGTEPLPETQALAEAIRAGTLEAAQLDRAFRRAVPEHVDEALGRALDPNRVDRFQGVVPFMAALQRPGSPDVLAAPTGWGSRILAIMLTVLAAAAAVWWTTISPPAPGGAVRSVVVLPFQNMTGDAAEEPFLGFLRDELSGHLAQIDGVEKVISRYSAAQFAGAAPPRVAEALDVDAVVTAMATVGNDSVTLSVELNAGREDRVLLSDVYARPVRDVEALLHDVTRDVVDALEITLGVDERTTLQEEDPVDPAALRAWALGTAELHQLTIDGMERAIDFFRQAIAVDRTFAPAHAGLAMAYSELAGWWGPPGETEEYAALAREALQFDPGAAEAYLALGTAAKYQWDWTTADQALREGMMWSPEASFAHVMYANFLTLMGRYDESIPAAREAVGMDPLAPTVYNELAFALWRSGDVEGARRAFSDSRRVAPDFHQTLALQSMFYADIGEGENAVRHARRLGDTDSLGEAYNAWVYGVSGHQDQARAIQAELEILEREEPVSPVAFALVHLGLDEWEQALMRLEDAYERRSPSLVGLKEAPMYDPLRSDPRFQDLVDRMGFPE